MATQRITLAWGGEERSFFLPIGGLRAVQAKCDAGPEEIAARLLPAVTAIDRKLDFSTALLGGLVGRYRVDDVRETIFQGLIGGGASQIEASGLVHQFIDTPGASVLRDNVPLAFAILMAAISGVPDEPGEREGEAVEEAASPSRKSGSANSTGRAPARGSRRGKSTP